MRGFFLTGLKKDKFLGVQAQIAEHSAQPVDKDFLGFSLVAWATAPSLPDISAPKHRRHNFNPLPWWQASYKMPGIWAV
jgi:hypothetical protein